MNSEYLKEIKEEDFDITLSENDLRTMKKTQYQNKLKLMFYDQQNAANESKLSNYEKYKKEKNDQKSKSLIHLDWACKLTNIREKFLPDFETLDKKSFHRISKLMEFSFLLHYSCSVFVYSFKRISCSSV